MKPAALELNAITLEVGGHRMIDKLSLTIAPGEVVTVMGPSGCGKSSLLSYICGTLPTGFTASGEVRLGGRRLDELPPERRGLGILFQDDLLFAHLSVGGNLGFALPRSLSRAERRARIEAALEEAGLAGTADRDPATLSGGQRARVALLRTLLSEPGAVLLDEPFSKLDADLRQRIREFVFAHTMMRDLPVLLVTHDEADAKAAGGRRLLLKAETPLKR